MLEPIAEKVTLVHRRDKFRAHEHSVALLEISKVEILTPYVPVSLEGQRALEIVILKEAKGDTEKEIEANDVLVNYGFVSSLGPIKGWDLNIEGNLIVVNSKQETNIEGIYAACDICTYDGKINLIATGFGEAATAVSNAKVYIEPSAKVQPLHSTSLMEKKDKSRVRKNIFYSGKWVTNVCGESRTCVACGVAALLKIQVDFHIKTLTPLYR